MKIYGPMVEQGICRIRTNQKLSELYKDLDIVTDIKKESLEWIEYVVRLDHENIVKKIFENKPERGRGRGKRRRRRMGRPRLRW
jgi:hypothetical protein